MAPLSNLPDQVIEQTFLNGLIPWIKTEVEVGRPTNLAQMMQLEQLVKNREIVRAEANLQGNTGGNSHYVKLLKSKSGGGSNTNENKSNATWPMRTITLKEITRGPKKEGPSRRLSDAEFQARKEKDLCF